MAQEPVKTTLDLASICTAATINVTALNEWVSLIAGTLAAIWGAIRLTEWIIEKVRTLRKNRPY